MLVSLLLGNVIVNETLPVFLDTLTGGGGIIAIVTSSSLIVIFGEIIPQAVCSHAGLAIGAKCTRFVQALMYLEAPIAWPIAKLLDSLLGSQHGTMYRKIELKTLVGLHGRECSCLSIRWLSADPRDARRRTWRAHFDRRRSQHHISCSRPVRQIRIANYDAYPGLLYHRELSGA